MTSSYDDQFSLQDKDFSQERLTVAESLERPEIVNVNFNGCDIAGLVAHEGRADRISLVDTRLRGVTWAKATIRDCKLTGVTGDSVSLRFSTMRNVTFTDVFITGLDLSSVSFEKVEFVNCRLPGVAFTHATVKSLTFTGCDLAGASGVEALRGATVHPDDAMTMTYSMATALGIKLTTTS